MKPVNNQQLRELFALPPIQTSAGTALAVPEMPPQSVVTGDREVDAVLWLQTVVKTGNQVLIDKAMEAAKRIKTPMKVLGDRYGRHVLRETKGNTMTAVFSSFGFGNLEEQAERAVQRAVRRHEAFARFGDLDSLFADTAAERACVKALRGVKKPKKALFYDDSAVAERFAMYPALTPTSIADCLHVLAYWDSLYWFRHAAADNAGDGLDESYAHDGYCFSMMAQIQPGSAAEAMMVFDHMTVEDKLDRSASEAILRNLVRSGWHADGSGDQ